MTVKQCCLSRVAALTLLFAIGWIIIIAVFPLLRLGLKARSSYYQDMLKRCWLQSFAAILDCRITVVGKLPEPGVMVVGNHISWVDVVVLGSLLPGYFVAKSDVSGWPVIGFLARRAGTVFIRRGDKKHIQGTLTKMAWLLKHGKTVIWFPEGTTSCGNQVLPFRASLFEAAVLSGAWVQPVVISYHNESAAIAPFIGDDEFLAHLLKILTLKQLNVRVEFLPACRSDNKTRTELSTVGHDLIQTRVSEQLSGILLE